MTSLDNHNCRCQALVTMRLEDVSIGEEDEEDLARPFLLNTCYLVSSFVFLLSRVTLKYAI